MSQKGKIPAEEKMRIVELYLSGKVGYSSACREAGVDKATFKKWLSRYKTEGPSGFLPKEHNRIYSKETKLSAVLDYLAGQGSMYEICEKYGVKDKRQLGNWLKVYNRHEELREQTGGSRMTRGRDTTAEERIQIVKECISNGNDYGTTALKYKVSYQQVYTWTRKYREMGESGLEDRRGHRSGTLPSRTPEEELRDRIAQLEREKYDLEMENALLKKVKELERRRR
ncbi:helix-turn-helix domain-containing protein [Desulfosporosinus hippei]|uniref:Transposase and inactivated derivatives n=1 Tax=Desulfosporosinus hippei DSM 8344 TaxID=1121419 RepID=A0A1G8LAZ0_9FIRM|nr:helix-turn-helix domain-containing protein [Desulfosporosinus hippei]SDI52811.1 Transposase and inactivated derivatives [Desulfosporosinus hippei DSM 8344]